MKKTIFTILVMATVALVINKSQTKAELTELEKANVEALADIKPVIKGCRSNDKSKCYELDVTPNSSGYYIYYDYRNQSEILN